MPRRSRRPTALTLLGVLALGACSSTDPEKPAPDPSGTSPSEPAPEEQSASSTGTRATAAAHEVVVPPVSDEAIDRLGLQEEDAVLGPSLLAGKRLDVRIPAGDHTLVLHCPSRAEGDPGAVGITGLEPQTRTLRCGTEEPVDLPARGEERVVTLLPRGEVDLALAVVEGTDGEVEATGELTPEQRARQLQADLLQRVGGEDGGWRPGVVRAGSLPGTDTLELDLETPRHRLAATVECSGDGAAELSPLAADGEPADPGPGRTLLARAFCNGEPFDMGWGLAEPATSVEITFTGTTGDWVVGLAESTRPLDEADPSTAEPSPSPSSASRPAEPSPSDS